MNGDSDSHSINQEAWRSLTENEISRVVVESALEVHKVLGGPGLLESVYEEALCSELGRRAMMFRRQVEVPLVYKGRALSTPLRIDLVVGDKVIVECKAVSLYNAVFESQVLTYLGLTGLHLGLVINFGEVRVGRGIHRVVNKLGD